MRYLFGLTLIFFLFITCTPRSDQNNTLEKFIPEDSRIILQLNNLSNFKSNLRNCEYLSQSQVHSLLSPGTLPNSLLKYVESDSSALISLTNANDTERMLIATWANIPSNDGDTTSISTPETLTTNGISLRKHQKDTLSWYSTIQGNVQLWSSQPEVLTEILKEDTPADPELIRLLSAANNRSSASLFLKTGSDPFIQFFPFTRNGITNDSIKSFWQVMDLELSQGGITGTGVIMKSDSGQTWASSFQGSILENRIASIAPLGSDAVISFTRDFTPEYDEIEQDTMTINGEELSIFTSIASAGVIFMGNQRSVVLDIFDSSEMETLLDQLKVNSRQFQGSEIIELNNRAILDSYINKVISGFNAQYVTRLENQFIFAEQASTLEQILQDYNRGTVFELSNLYENTADFQSREASLQFIANSRGMQSLLQEPLFSGEQSHKDPSLFPVGYAYSGQLLSGSDYLLNNMAVNRITKKAESNTTTEVFRLQLDAEAATIPQFVINHRNRQKEIVVQDETNKLYLISGDGKVLWKKQLDSRIQGEIKQVDLYKNGRLQLAFTTNDQFLVLDRNGKEVLPFNMRFSGGNLNPLAVFDYENNRNYRFVITQGRKIYMYNRRGQVVSGYTYTEAASAVIREPQHFRVGSRDYLVFQLENGSLEIRNRVGQTRVPVSQRFSFSNNPVYLYRNQFTFTDDTGRLYSIDTKGKLSASRLNLDALHHIDATSKTLATLTENTLTIKGKPVTLDLGVYTAPKIFYLYDKIYVSVTDLQAEKVYLFDSQTKPISGFPVFGTDAMRLDDMNNDRKLELVTKGQENDLILYRMN